MGAIFEPTGPGAGRPVFSTCEVGGHVLTWAWDRLVRSERNWLGLPEQGGELGRVVDFLSGIAEREDVVFHGSNTRSIEIFQPRKQTTFHGEVVEAVFATPDPVWPLFFAVTDTALVQSRWNSCALPRTIGVGTRSRPGLRP